MSLIRASIVLAAILSVSFSSQPLEAQNSDPNQQDRRGRVQEQRQRMQRGRRARMQSGQRRRGQQTFDENSLIRGELAPDFTLKSLDGETETTLSDFRGKGVIISFL